MPSSEEKKITLYGDILKDTAALEYVRSIPGFGLPAEEDRQRDLQYIVAVLVSSGMNLNGAVFLPSEMISARDTMLHKPLDVEHMEGYVVGHIHDRAFITKDRELIDPVSLFSSLGNKIDNEDLDIAVLMSLYKYRFPDVANDVEEGKYKVSMECYYRDFDIKIGDIIISKTEAKGLGLDVDGKVSHVGKVVKVLAPDCAEAYIKIGRVFRDIMFSGCGLVEYPANLDSDILAAASAEQSPDVVVPGVVIDLSKSETYLKTKQIDERIEVADTPVPVISDKEVSGFTDKGPASVDPGQCVSFKRYVRSYTPDTGGDFDEEHPPHDMIPPGLGEGPDDKIIHENWCSLFDVGCTSFGADATHPLCLRNVLNQATKDSIDSFGEVRNDVNWNSDVWPLLESLRDSSQFVEDFLARLKK